LILAFSLLSFSGFSVRTYLPQYIAAVVAILDNKFSTSDELCIIIIN